ncbi:MAG: esterase [Bacteroidetes bacterium]|nr:MAG: esterase [Bacteroidota bacterium]
MIRALLLSLSLILFSFSIQAQGLFVIKTQLLENPDTVAFYLPKGYSPMAKKKYPVVFMLHGYGGNYKQMGTIINLQNMANSYGFIIVCPDGQLDSWYFDSPSQKNSEFETFFFHNLMPYVKNEFNIDTSAIFITGLSMGGHGAMYLYLRHSTWFAAAGSSSGVLDLNASSLKYSSLSTRLGEYKQQRSRFDSYSAINLLDSIKFTDKPLIFDCGNMDHLYQANKDFKEACDSLHINAFYFSFSGRHNRAYWRESLPMHFRFFYQVYLLGLKNN